MSMYEVGRDLLGEIASIRRPRQISRLFRFIRTKNRIVRRHTSVVCEAPRVSPCLISLARDGGHLTKAFLIHYMDLGFRSFAFLDNGSMDRCASRLIDVAKRLGCDLTVYRCNLSYKRYKHSMKNFLVASVPVGAWTFCADVDEFLVPPDGVRGVAPVITYLEEKGYDTVQFHLLDMFSDKPLHALEDETKWSSSDLGRHYRYFDTSVLRSVRVNRGAYLKHKGGVRLKHLGVLPNLTKATFFKKTSEATNLRSSHSFLPSPVSRPRTFADFTLFAKHYKFHSRYVAGLELAVKENSYYDNSAQCRPILSRLNEAPSFTLGTETTQEYRDFEQLRARALCLALGRFPGVPPARAVRWWFRTSGFSEVDPSRGGFAPRRSTAPCSGQPACGSAPDL